MLPADVIAARTATRLAAGEDEDQILFGDLHVHTTLSADAFQLALPLLGGVGTNPLADACDYARYCSALDFWSLNDHAEAITPQLWQESVASIRQCNAVAGAANDPDVVSYLGWEWTQVGATPETHFGHRNVILRDLADDAIPARPIAAASSRVGGIGSANPFVRGAMVAARVHDGATHDFARKLTELHDTPRCPAGVPTRELPSDCLESASTPGELMAKLREWESAALVIPHGTAWGWTASPLASWETQLGADAHDETLQRLIEVHSGHGNSEEYRAWRPLVRDASGALVRVWSAHASADRTARSLLAAVREQGEGFEVQLLSSAGLVLDDADVAAEFSLNLAERGPAARRPASRASRPRLTYGARCSR